MHRAQRGVTLLGWLFLLIPIAVVGYAAIRAIPIYLNYFKVVRVLDQIDEGLDSSSQLGNIRVALENRLYIEGVEFPTAQDMQVRRDGQTWIIDASYEDEAPLFYNMSLRFVFEKSVEVR